MSEEELQSIKGIGPKYAQALSAGGVVSIADIAGSTPEALAEIVQAPAGRARYADWIAQAQALSDSEEAAQRAEIESLLVDLKALTVELQELTERAEAGLPTPDILAALKERGGRYTPEALRAMQDSLEGTTVEDFKDVETWKGLWFTLDYLLRLEASERKERLGRCLTRLPGAGMLADIRSMLTDTPPEEFLNPETWKGVLYVLNYELQNRVRELRQRSEEEEDGA